MKEDRNKTKELQTRRDFFKKAGKKILPLFASLSLVAQIIPIKAIAKEQIGCGWTCMGTCMTGCLYSCGGSCLNGCYMSCMNACAMSCGNSCRGGCNDTCAQGCSSCVAECRIGCGKGCSGSCIAQCSSYSEHVAYWTKVNIYERYYKRK